MTTFKLRLSLISPIGTKLEDKTFEFDKELQAKDMLDMCKVILNKYSFETYEEYLNVYKLEKQKAACIKSNDSSCHFYKSIYGFRVL